ncbi:MAG: hypothetical protein HMLKMBBP_02309 [Planctomycetes bacterium]|nr:hypothetical protein [Planctomycetota bacterium]
MADPTPSVRASVIGATDVGRVREHNEDSFLVLDGDSGRRLASGEQHDGELRKALVLAVCDGMGGAAAGEVASRMAADRVAAVLGKADLAASSADQIAALLDQSVQQANAEILQRAKDNPEMRGMGTTLTAAVATQGRLFVSQVGDSRAYLLRNGHLNQITKDQSLIGQLIEEGTLTEEEAEKYGAKNIVLQAVGVEESLRVDTKHWPLLRGDVVLLCSDGLSGMVKDARLKDVLSESGTDLRTAVDRLILEANDNGGRDNITAIVARFDGEGLRAPMETSGGEVEAAGASFKAPPPPDVPNPMKKVGLFGLAGLAAVVGVILAFRQTTATLEVAVKPEGVTLVVKDASGAVVREVKAGARTVIEGLDPGNYSLTARAPKHFDEDRSFSVEKSGQFPIAPVDLVPRPAKLVVRTTGRDVTIVLDVKSPHPKLKDVKEPSRLPNAGDSRTFGDLPPGDLVLTASRAGFRDFVDRRKLEPESEQTVTVPALVEILGDLSVRAPDGATVDVLASDGEKLASGRAAGGAFAAKVRTGDVTVVVTAPGFREFRATAKVAEGGAASLDARLSADLVPVRFRGPAGAELVFEVHDGQRWAPVPKADTIYLDREGSSTRSPSVPPGKYRVRNRDGGSWNEFDIPAGSGPVDKQVNGS